LFGELAGGLLGPKAVGFFSSYLSCLPDLQNLLNLFKEISRNNNVEAEIKLVCI
jgi:hypothetical protein